MDQLTAYRVLGISEGSSVKEIKEAYAALSKVYHPEEHPEEFQQIHEAYSLLIRMSRGRNRSAERRQPSMEMEFTGRQEEHEERSRSQGYRFEERDERREEQKKKQETERVWQEFEADHPIDSHTRIDITEDSERQENASEPEWDFDSALHWAEQRERADAHELTLRALSEMEILLTPEYMHKLKLFKAFFAKPEYQEVLKSPEFIGRFALLLQNTHLKKRIYDYFIDYYRLRGMAYNQLMPEARALYDVLERKRGMQAKSKENAAYIIPAAIFPAVRMSLRNVDFSKELVIGLGSIILLLIFGIWLYRKLYENHSSIFSQAMIALLIMAVQLVVLFSGAGAFLFGSMEAGDVISVLLFALAGIWLLVLGIAAVILKIRNRDRKKR